VSGFFELFGSSAWRLEVQPFYGPDAEEFGRYQHGRGPNQAQRHQRQQWIDGIAAAAGAGRVVGRVLVVSLPLSPYWRWRLETAAQHAVAGERIHVADRGRHPALAELDQDFWIFDESWAVLLDYQPDGTFLGGRDAADPAVLNRCHRDRGLAVAASVPLAEFLLRRGQWQAQPVTLAEFLPPA
jgi:hypothetical protein